MRSLSSREYTSLDRSPMKVAAVKMGAYERTLAVPEDYGGRR